MSESTTPEKTKFPPLFWLVIVFEFFERGAYYGMMSVLSVYFTDQLLFSKESVGVIKSVIQPILYFLPIVAGALADRFGFRRALTVAFALLGAGYFLTSQFTDYTKVFLSLAVMALGAGTFKPVISGSIAKTTDESNSTIGFGIYYWSINLGAFLFPLILVPYLKATHGWSWVIIASAICTGAMIIPTLLFFREPPAPKSSDAQKAPKKNLVRTVADAFEIIYSPFVLLFGLARRHRIAALLLTAAWCAFFLYALNLYLSTPVQKLTITAIPCKAAGKTLLVEMSRNQSSREAFAVKEKGAGLFQLSVFKPGNDEAFTSSVLEALQKTAGLTGLSAQDVAEWMRRSEVKIELHLRLATGGAAERIVIEKWGERKLSVAVSAAMPLDTILEELRGEEILAGLDASKLKKGIDKAGQRPFFLLFLSLLFATAFLILGVEKRVKSLEGGARSAAVLAFGGAMMLVIWLLPGLSVFTRVLTSVIYSTILSLFIIDLSETGRFKDHFRFLLMIFLYSGFWVLYFQMFDSVLWYVKAYVDATSLNSVVNSLLSALGISYRWYFDVEHVTVINAGTIICLQLLVSRVVKNTKALPTMIMGILFGTIGIAILAISTDIWVFIAGTIIFSIGEMTAHPKFISYVGQTAPRERLAMYMGYIFLYGVIGSSIGGILGANLYVHFVDHLNQPRVLWLIFACIGVATIVGLLLYNRFFGGHEEKAAVES